MEIVSAELWKDGAAPMAWAAGRIYFNRRRVSNGVFDGWSCLPDGTDERNHTDIGAFPTKTHAGISDVTTDGKFAVSTVERSGWWPFKPVVDGDGSASPGRGVWNDIWIHDLASNKAWCVRKFTNWGIIWPRLSPDGTKIAWAELVSPELFLPGIIGIGKWNLCTADLVWAMGVPSLKNIKTKVTDSFVEPYGFTADNSSVLFAGDKIAGKYWPYVSICKMKSDLSGSVTVLSPPDPPEYWANYNEFAYFIPETDRILFMRTTDTEHGSLEMWTMKSDGTDVQRLSWFETQDNSKNMAGGLAFNPENPRQFVCGFATDYADQYKSRMILLSGPTI